MKRNSTSTAGMQLQAEVRVPVLVRVKSHTRNQSGKIVKVRSYLRRAWDTPGITIRISTR